jgi:preprotein translocase subunit YajC
MSHAWPYLLMVFVLGGLLVFSMRNQRRKAAEQMARVSQLQLGSEVMTTSGLYGTIVHRNADGTVQLSIAPGVKVKWALAALRDVESLPPQYREGLAEGRSGSADGRSGSADPPEADVAG